MLNGEQKKSCIFQNGLVMGQTPLRTNPEPISLTFPCIKEQCLFYNEIRQKCRFLTTMEAIEHLAVNILRTSDAKAKE